MAVVVTRPRAEARRLAQVLAEHGHEVLLEPMLTIEPLAADPPSLGGVQALIVTSANAAPALRALAPAALPVFAVGDATARAVHASGMGDVNIAAGESTSLAGLIAARCRPEDGALLHVSGTEVRAGLGERLTQQGFEVRQHPVYAARAATTLSPAFVAAAHGRAIDAVLLFSPRTASTFVDLVIRHGLERLLDAAVAVCISYAAAEPCRRLVWQRVAVATRPDTAALLELLDGPQGRC